MKVYYGGQIKEECRGDQAAVVSRQTVGQEKSPWCDVLIYPISSEEFIHLTGVRAVTNPIERAYIGISNELGDKIATLLNGRHIDATDLRSIDTLCVISHFVDKNLDKPERIVLESTPDGFKVADLK